MIDFTPQPWTERSACRDADPELFHSPDGDRDNNEGAADRRDREERAKAICGRCPVRGECLTYVLATESPSSVHGVWGGLTEDERARLLRRRQHDAARAAKDVQAKDAPAEPAQTGKLARHRTYTGAGRHRRVDEPLCEPCKHAERAHQRTNRASRAKAVVAA
jgi:WhiB family redox-sensing transcriptional regulator